MPNKQTIIGTTMCVIVFVAVAGFVTAIPDVVTSVVDGSDVAGPVLDGPVLDGVCVVPVVVGLVVGRSVLLIAVVVVVVVVGDVGIVYVVGSSTS